MKVVAMMVILVLAIVGLTQGEPLGPRGDSSMAATSSGTTLTVSGLELDSSTEQAVPMACYSRYTCLQGGLIFSSIPACQAAACGQCVLYERCCNGVCTQP